MSKNDEIYVVYVYVIQNVSNNVQIQRNQLFYIPYIFRVAF